MRYEKMSKDELLQELLDRGISCFDEKDARSSMIEALYQDDEYAEDHPDSYEYHPKNSEW